MKLYFAAIDGIGNVATSVSEGTAMELLKQVFVSLPTGEFDLAKATVADRVEEIDTLFATTFAGLETPKDVIDFISKTITHKNRDDALAEHLAEELMIHSLVDDGPDLVDFLSDLREIFEGTSYDMASMTEEQTTLIARIEM